MTSNENFFSLLRAGFPLDMDGTAIEATAPDGSALRYTWRDLDHASARIANLLASLKLPAGARVAVQMEKSVEALALYLATLRAGCVFLPLNTACRSADVDYLVCDAQPAVVVCRPGAFGWVSKIAFQAGAQTVYTLGNDRSGSLLQRAAHHADTHTPAERGSGDLAAMLYTSGTTGPSERAILTHGHLLLNAAMFKDCWGWRPDDVPMHSLPVLYDQGLFAAGEAAKVLSRKSRWLLKRELLALGA